MRTRQPLFLMLPVFLLFSWVFPLHDSLHRSPPLAPQWPQPDSNSQEEDLTLVKVITGQIRPKSIVHSGHGRFFAQNMMYRHSITVYDRNFNLIKTIPDQVRLSDYLVLGYTGLHQGSPVEACFSQDGRYAYISNYQMYGQGFDAPGGDACDSDANYDHSYVYRIAVDQLTVDQVIAVGSVPKYLAATPDGRLVLVSNWCSGDLSVIDTELGKEIARVPLGQYPRGITIDSKSRFAYVALMGDDRLAVINLTNPEFPLTWIEGLERTPRHLCIGPADRFLYITLSRPGKVIKYDLVKGAIVGEVDTGREARSMVLTPQGQSLYVVNYDDNTLSKVSTETMQVVHTVETRKHPIGVTFDPQTRRVWVACYHGAIMVFQDQRYLPPASIVQHDQIGPLPPAEDQVPAVSQVPGAPKSHPSRYYYIKRATEGETTKAASATPTRTRAITPLPTDVTAPEATDWTEAFPAASGPQFYIVVGSYRDLRRAEQRVAELRDEGYAPLVRNNGQGQYRVCSHAFAQKADALAALDQVKDSLHAEAWILAE